MQSREKGGNLMYKKPKLRKISLPAALIRI